jgi:hypothetical protein
MRQCQYIFEAATLCCGRAWILEEYSMFIGFHGTWEDPGYPSFSLYQVTNMNKLKK